MDCLKNLEIIRPAALTMNIFKNHQYSTILLYKQYKRKQ